MSHIRLTTLEEQRAAVLLPDRFEFNANSRAPWLQKLLFVVLRWLRANAYDTHTTYTTTEVDTSKIIDAVLQNASDAERLYFKRAKYIVMGPRDFARFTNVGKNTHPQFLQFNFDARLGFGSSVTACGLECVVVPWIEGFFVMPDLTRQ